MSDDGDAVYAVVDARRHGTFKQAFDSLGQCNVSHADFSRGWCTLDESVRASKYLIREETPGEGYGALNSDDKLAVLLYRVD